MDYTRTSIKFIFCIFLFSSILACKSKKHFITEDLSTQVSKDSIYNSIFHPISINTFSGKAKIKISDDYGTEKATMFVRMQSDSAIFTVFKKLSVEGGRSLINKDSVFIINRMERSFQKFGIDTLQSLYGVTPELATIERLVTGRLPQIDSSAHWEEKENDSHYFFRTMNNDMLVDFGYSKSTGLLTEGQFYDKYQTTGSWHFDDYRFVNNLAIPFLRNYKIEIGEEKKLNITIEFSEIEIDEKIEINFRIPSHYTRTY